MFWGAGVIVLPLTLAYTAAVYFIFRGRVTDADGYGGEMALGQLTAQLPVASPAKGTGKAMEQVLYAAAIVNVLFDFIRRRR